LDEYVAEQVVDAERDLSELPDAERVLQQWRAHEGKALVPRLRQVYRWLRSAGLSSESRIATESRIKALGRRANDIIEDWAELMTDEVRLWKHFETSGISKSAVEATVRWCVGQELESPEEEGDAGEVVATDVDGRSLDEDSRAGL